MLRLLDGLRRLWRTKRWVKWAVYLLPVLAILVLLGPALGVLHQILKLTAGFLLPLLQTPGGRFLLVNLLVVALVLLLYWKGRSRVAALFAFAAMRHFLRGLQLLSGGFTRRAIRSFQRVLRIARWVNLERALPAYPEIAVDARVRLAMCWLKLGEADQALRCLELARKDRPPPGVMKGLRELRAIAYYYHPTMARETADKELEDAHRRDPGNPRLCRAVVDKCETDGDSARGLELRKTIFAAAEGRDREKERLRLLEGYHDEARRLLAAGDLGRARGLLRDASTLAEESEPIQLLLGDVELRRRSDEAALKAWARVPGPAARRRVAEMLARFEDPRELLERYPQPELLIDLAVCLIERGAQDQARRTLEKARELGADEVEIEKVLGDLAVAASEPQRARQHYLRAMTSLFGGKLLGPGA
ncbi:MAG: hypothetical protein JXQ29_15370 [Planctomycetes bacterium]|nr:hypothetical protein [Planctomycetota bacterium]